MSIYARLDTYFFGNIRIQHIMFLLSKYILHFFTANIDLFQIISECITRIVVKQNNLFSNYHLTAVAIPTALGLAKSRNSGEMVYYTRNKFTVLQFFIECPFPILFRLLTSLMFFCHSLLSGIFLPVVFILHILQLIKESHETLSFTFCIFLLVLS